MQAEPFIRRAQPWLGTLVEIAVPGACAQLIDGAFETIADVHAAMSFHSDTSDLARLRRAGPHEIVQVSRATVKVLRAAQHLFDLTDGVFDVTTAAELVEWGFLPRPEGWTRGASDATAADIEILDDCHVRLNKPLLIDLGGIAKGFAVDEAVKFLQRGGAETAIVNAGGDLRVFGETAYPVSVLSVDRSGVADNIMLQDGAVATSSNAQTRKKVNGRLRAPHLTKDRDAALYNGSVSVCSPLAIYADALTKVALSDAVLAAKIAPKFDAQFFFRTEK